MHHCRQLLTIYEFRSILLDDRKSCMNALRHRRLRNHFCARKLFLLFISYFIVLFTFHLATCALHFTVHLSLVAVRDFFFFFRRFQNRCTFADDIFIICPRYDRSVQIFSETHSHHGQRSVHIVFIINAHYPSQLQLQFVCFH